MASFNDYLKEVDYFKQQLKADRDTLAIRREQLSFFKGFYGDKYENMLDTFDIAFNELGNVIDMMEGWIPVIEKDIPEDEKFLSEMELKAKAFDDILHSWRKNQYPEEFDEEVTDIINELLEKVSCEPDPELDQEPEEIPEQETIFDDSKNGVEGFNEFLKKLK